MTEVNTINRRSVGSGKEQEAVNYLRERGYTIIAQNFYSAAGEIDIIAENDGYLCFIEVKYRTSGAMGSPQEAVDLRKMRRISRAAEYYCYKYRNGQKVQVRFDVVAMTPEDTTLIKNAFDYI